MRGPGNYSGYPGGGLRCASRRGRYPASAPEMALATGGFGTWTDGWLMEELASPALRAFGTQDLTASGTPTFGVAGARPGTKAIALGADGNTNFVACPADSTGFYNVGATQDLVLAYVGKVNGLSAGTRPYIGKRGPVTAYYTVQLANGVTQLVATFTDGTTSVNTPVVSDAGLVGSWHVGLLVLERGAVNQGRFITDKHAPAATAIGALGAMANTIGLGIGAYGVATADVTIDAMWIGIGVNAAAGCIANAATIVANLKRYVGLQ